MARLPLDFRIRFTRELVSALIATGGFVAGFYSTTRGIVMERVRTNLLGEIDRVPEEHAALYDAARTELLTEFKGVGQSRLIKQLLLHPFSALSNLLASFDCTFRVRYDPRSQREDQVNPEVPSKKIHAPAIPAGIVLRTLMRLLLPKSQT